jgi:hypothetical protein
MNQAVTFLSDSGDTVRDLQKYLNPQADIFWTGSTPKHDLSLVEREPCDRNEMVPRGLTQIALMPGID